MNKKFLQVATDVAKEASEILKGDFYEPRPTPLIDEKGVHLQTDFEIEQLIKGRIGNEFPDHSFQGEEEGNNGKESDYKWIVDPIDGTSNYFCHNPFFCVSIALTYQNELVLGVIDAPIINEGFIISKNESLRIYSCIESTTPKRPEGLSAPPNLGGEFEERIINPEIVSFDKIVIGGRSYQSRCENIENYSIKNDKTYTKIEMGAAALELAYVASGKIQGYMVEGIKDWDVAAGVLMVREMGGKVLNWKGEDWSFGDTQLVAGREDIVEGLLEKVSNLNSGTSSA